MDRMREIQVIRSKRKTLSLIVKNDGEIVVRAPLRTPQTEISAFVERHKSWLEKRLSSLKEIPVLELSDGARVCIFGQEYTVCTGARARLAEDSLYLPASDREGALIRLLKRETLNRLGALTERVAAQYGFRFLSVRVSSARTRWGSCNRDRRIAYSFRTAFLPEELIFYVVVHELCHTRFFSHNKAFWSEVERVLPNYHSLRKSLKERGFIMNFL